MTIAPNESTPLIHGAQNHLEAQEPCIQQATPLPKLQLALICFIRIMDPIAFTQLFPYVNEFITYLRVTDDPSQTGFYSGLVESTFAVTQLFANYQWSRLSDRIGRKPTVLVGTFGIALSTVYFGLSGSLTDLLVSRALAGIFSGAVTVVQSMVGEITDASNQATAFPIYSLVWPIGSIVGPLIGGVLSNPADKYGSFFQNSVFNQYPYLLPCLVAGILALFGVFVAYIFLEETLPKGRENPCPDNRTPTLRELLSIPIFRALSISAFALYFNGIAFDVLFVLLCYSPIKNGGLAFSPSSIGITLASSGLISSSLQFTMPIILKRIEAAKAYNMFVSVWPIVFASLPVLNIIARYGLDEETGNSSPYSKIILWIGLLFVLALSKIGYLAYGVVLILTRINTKPEALAVSNGVVSGTMSLARTISPALTSSVFVLSQEYNLLGGYFWAWMMVCSCLLACSFGRNISRLSQSSLKHQRTRIGCRT